MASPNLVHSVPVPEANAKGSPALIHPLIDFLMIGGLSILFFAGMHAFRVTDSSTNALGWNMFYISFVINFPHFLISYQHFYGDHRKRLFQDWKWIGVAFGVPLFLVGWFAYGYAMEDMRHLGIMVNVMFFLVGWHYVKQIFGCFIVCSSRAAYRTTSGLRLALKTNLYCLWAMSYLNGNRVAMEHEFYSFKYMTFAIPDWALGYSFLFTLVSAAWVLKEIFAIFIEDGKWPTLTAWTAWISIYVWYIPSFYHPAYFLMIPAFHSMQYLLFSWAYTKNRIKREAYQGPLEVKKKRARFIGRLSIYLGSSFVLGALFFNWLPKVIDQGVSYPEAMIGTTFFMACFQLFLNIHHYFIDHLIWRGTLPEVKENLLKT